MFPRNNSFTCWCVVPSLFLFHRFVHGLCVHPPTLRLRKTLTLTLCIHCCNKWIENLLQFSFSFDALTRVTPHTHTCCVRERDGADKMMWSGKKVFVKNVQDDLLFPSTHEIHLRIFSIFLIHQFSCVLLFISCNALVRKQHLKLTSAYGCWVGSCRNCSERHMQEQTELAGAKCMHASLGNLETNL